MILTSSEIKAYMSSKDFSRGSSYFKQNKVKKCLVNLSTDKKLKISGSVLGSYASAYSQDITITKENNIIIFGNCSCPVGYNCKHVVAVCLEYILNGRIPLRDVSEESIKEEALSQWLCSFDVLDDTQSMEELQETNEYFVTYRLFSKERGFEELKFYKSKFLKKGGIGKGIQLEGYKFVDSYYYSEIKNEVDNKIAQTAKNLDFGRWRSATETFKGSFGRFLLEDIVKTGRCYYDENQEPLRKIEGVFKTEFDFKLYKGEYTLKSNVDKGYKLLNTSPAFILDTLENTLQEFDTELELYKKLIKSPKIDKKNIVKVCKVLGKSAPSIEIKTPRGFVTRVIHKERMIPQIEFEAQSFKIDFLYDSFNLKYMPQQSVSSFYEKDEKVEIHRSLEAEEDARKRIESFGFETTVLDENLCVNLKNENKQKQLNAFKTFLDTHLLDLENDGWAIKNLDNFAIAFESDSELIVESEEKNDWFSLSFNLEYDGKSQAIAPLVTGIIEEFGDLENMPEAVNIEVEENRFVEVQTKQILPIIKTIIELMDKKDRSDSLKLSSFDAHLIANLDEDIVFKGSREILELSKKLKNFKGIESVLPPKALQASLRAYQRDGLNWLNFLYEFKFSGILADDMGLGKTIQTLSFLSKLKEDGKLQKPILIIMPTSLIANWKNEVKKFTPNLNVLSLHGKDRAERFEFISENDILLTTYALVVRDEELFKSLEFSYIVLDEAQKIKNPRTKMAQSIKSLKSEYRLALSGTPIENHLGELWSIFSFLMPGFLDSQSFFKKYYQMPIEKEHDFSRQVLLNKRVKPFMIRRTKELVASELPAKSEIIKYTQFDSKQAGLYESIRVSMEKKVAQAVENKGLASSHITMLDALLKLRQVCCDPSLLKIKEAQKLKESAKLELLLDLLEELLAEGRKILIFSQFTSMLAIIEEKIKSKKISYTKLTGNTSKREEAIQAFTDGKVDLFLISLKAGGVGLNLTQADTVIHYDPWWNPAVENQATDRAYRIGQKKAVFVYKLIVENTIEQKILELQKKKQSIGDSIYDENQQQEDLKFNSSDLLELLE